MSRNDPPDLRLVLLRCLTFFARPHGRGDIVKGEVRLDSVGDGVDTSWQSDISEAPWGSNGGVGDAKWGAGRSRRAPLPNCQPVFRSRRAHQPIKVKARLLIGSAGQMRVREPRVVSSLKHIGRGVDKQVGERINGLRCVPMVRVSLSQATS